MFLPRQSTVNLYYINKIEFFPTCHLPLPCNVGVRKLISTGAITRIVQNFRCYYNITHIINYPQNFEDYSYYLSKNRNINSYADWQLKNVKTISISYYVKINIYFPIHLRKIEGQEVCGRRADNWV